MTFNIIVPNAGQSPGLFPAQNNTNFQRIKDIINNDHNFTDSSTQTQGYHKQMSLINRATAPVGLAGANSILYALADGGGASQLHFYNGAADYTITPIAAAPLKVTGSVVLAGGATSGTVYTIPNNSQGTIFVNYINPSGNFFRYYLFYKSGTTFVDGALLKDSSNSGKPDISISGSNIRVVNGGSGTKTVGYYIMVESIP